MNVGTDHYAVLGTPSTASDHEIRDAFRSAVRALHPDHNAGWPADHTAMTALVDAWQVLGDPVRRARYDAGRATSPTPSAPAEWKWTDQGRPWSTVSVRWLRLLFAGAVLLVAVLLAVFTLIAFAQSG